MLRITAMALCAWFCLLTFPLISGAAETEPAIGEIIEVEGSATLQIGNTAPQALAVDMPIYLGNKITTGADSRVLLLFIDETEITLSDDTHLTIDEYIFDPDSETANKAIFSFGRGFFQYVSGLIARRDEPDVTLKTPVGTLGIRGTKVLGGDIDDTYSVFVEEGLVTVETDRGETLLRRGEGSEIRGRKFKPGPAQAWAPERRQQFRKRFIMKRRAAIRERIQERRAKREQMRERMQEHIKQRREQWKKKKNKWQ